MEEILLACLKEDRNAVLVAIRRHGTATVAQAVADEVRALLLQDLRHDAEMLLRSAFHCGVPALELWKAGGIS